jgi:hypothetical protein
VAYDPKLLKFRRVIPGSVIGVSLVVGKSLLGEDLSELVDEEHLSSIELIDGYDVGSNGELSIDPLTGTATFAERMNAAPGDAVEAWAQQHAMYTGTNWELRYNDTIVAQGKVTRVETSMGTDGPYWVKKTKYVLAGAAVTMLNKTVTWTSALPAEGALTRLRRFFTVDTSQCRSTIVSYLNTVTAPSTPAGSSTLLDLARDFTEVTRFPVRTENTNKPVVGLTVVPVVVFAGSPPPPLILPAAKEWTLGAELLSDVVKPPFSIPAEKVQSVDVVKDYDVFIAGIGKQALEAGTLGVDFRLSQSRLARNPDSTATDIGVRAPAAIDFFGSVRVVSQINHSFSGGHYRSALVLVAPTEVS